MMTATHDQGEGANVQTVGRTVHTHRPLETLPA
ncbi:MAG: hypothetical protein RL297_538 [Pseudomonadota bacterium]|jgi:hypothetical protein